MLVVLPALDFMAQSSQCLWGFFGQRKEQVELECCNVLHVGRHTDVCMKVYILLLKKDGTGTNCKGRDCVSQLTQGQLLWDDRLKHHFKKMKNKKTKGKKDEVVNHELLATLYNVPSSSSYSVEAPWPRRVPDSHHCP